MLERELWALHYPAFATNPDAAVRRMMDAAKLLHLPRERKVFQPGSPCVNYLLLVEGSVRVQLVTANGREVLLYRVGPGGSCILTTSCLLGGNGYPAQGLTESPTTAFAVPEPQFRQALDQSDTFRRFVFGDFATRLVRVIGRLEEVLGGRIDARLARALLVGASSRPLQRTHQDLAAEIGTAREVISRHLKQFEERGWVRLGRGTVTILDRAGLEAFLAHPD